MIDLFLDALIDTAKLCPFLLIAFLIIEYFEKKFNEKSYEILNKNMKYGPIIGSLLGIVPQCGFSVFAVNLYSSGIITLGTLFAVLLSTSDELLPILFGSSVDFAVIGKLILVKVVIALIIGFAVDFFFKQRKGDNKDIQIDAGDCCQHGSHLNGEHHHHDEKSFIMCAITHTLETAFYILVTTFILNIVIDYIGEDTIASLLNNRNFFTPFIASAIGLIPNCAASVIIAELFINNIINFSSTVAGLLTGSGVAIMVLFRSNKSNTKENIKIVIALYLIGALSGVILNLLNF